MIRRKDPICYNSDEIAKLLMCCLETILRLLTWNNSLYLFILFKRIYFSQRIIILIASLEENEKKQLWVFLCILILLQIHESLSKFIAWKKIEPYFFLSKKREKETLCKGYIFKLMLVSIILEIDKELAERERVRRDCASYSWKRFFVISFFLCKQIVLYLKHVQCSDMRWSWLSEHAKSKKYASHLYAIS